MNDYGPKFDGIMVNPLDGYNMIKYFFEKVKELLDIKEIGYINGIKIYSSPKVLKNEIILVMNFEVVKRIIII